MGNETAAEASAPSEGKVRKAVRRTLEESNYKPQMTVGQIRARVQERLAPNFPSFDWSSPTFKAQVRTLTQRLVEEWSSSGQAPPAAPAPAPAKKSPATEDSGKKGKKRSSSGDDDGANDDEMPQWEPVGQSGTEGEDEQERRQKPKKPKASAPSAGASVASAASESSGSGAGAAAAAQDPIYKRLLKLAQAMALTPAILSGLGSLPVEEKTDALRQRLKAKGAVFDLIPSAEQIKQAEAATTLKKDLEGIDASNIVEGGRRRHASTGTAAATTTGSSTGSVSSASKETAARKGAGNDSGSEDEMEF